MSAEEQVGLVVNVNYDKLKELYEFWNKHNKEAQEDNKSTFERLSKSAGDFVKMSFTAAAGLAARDLARAVMPSPTTLAGATEAYKKFRDDNTRIAVAAGKNWEQVGDKLLVLGRKTGRNQDELKAYAAGVEQVTKRWDTAFESAEAYDKLAHKTGRDMGSYGGLAGTMENLFKIKGSKETEDFFDRLITKAKALGLNTNQAVSMFEKMAPSLGRSGMSANQASTFSTAMLKAGASPEQAEELGGFWNNYFKSGTRWIEREMRTAGVLKKGDKITDKWGRLNRPIHELIGMYYRTQKKIRRGMSKSQFRDIAIDNLGNEAGEMFANWEEIEPNIKKAEQADKGAELAKAKAAYKAAPAGQRKAKDVKKEQEDLGLGSKVLPWQDAAAGNGGFTNWLLGLGVTGLGAGVAGTGIKSLLGGAAAKGILGGLGTAATWTGGVALAGAAGYGVGTYADEKLGLSDKISDQFARWLVPGYAESRDYDGGVRTGQPASSAGAGADPKTMADAQGKATADKIAEKVLRVQVVGFLSNFANAAGPTQ